MFPLSWRGICISKSMFDFLPPFSGGQSIGRYIILMFASAVDGLDSSSQQTTDQEVLRLETPPPSSPSKGPVLSSTKRKTQIPPSPRSSSQQTTDHEIPRLETPPSSPSKRPILSPTKRKIQIPQSPHRESVDAFWNQEVTNDWVDQHSPRRLEQLVRDFEESDGGSPSDTMAKTLGRRAAKTPSKTALRRAETEKKKAQAARKKAFDNKKGSLAKDFLNVLDDAVSGGQVQRLAEGAGGVKIVWSKTLKKTAGRANWNGDRTALPGTSQATRYAAIELAERIIDDEDRLINTLAHEYCHLANFMISHIHNNPHGASFKHWGHKCKAALRDHPIYGGRIEVTTKHSYKIDFKYVWSCVDCSQTYGRHSKSINTARLRCAICRGVLQQIKPKPRNVSPRKQAPGEKRAVEDVARVLGEVSLHN